MINVKKGVAHSLQQADIRGTASTGIVAGMLCYVSSAGAVTAAGGSTYSQLGIRGFAINNSGDGDVIESNKIALYTLDGLSILETDQVDLTGDSAAALSAANYPVGTPLYASQATAGLVSKLASGTPGPIIGWVEGVRYLQNATPNPVSPLGGTSVSSTQNYTSETEGAAYAANPQGPVNAAPSTLSATYKAQISVPVLGIKLAASN